MEAILFGANGQDGHYLRRLLDVHQVTVTGIGREDINIADYNEVSALVQQHKPGMIFHLAANSTTRHEAVFENHTTISTGTLNILEAVKNFSPSAKVFISGSALQFKNEQRPINEAAPFEARDAYSVSRIHSVYAARYYRTLGVQAYVGYFFNHDSPLRGEKHVSKKIADAAKRIAKGSDEKLEIGDIKVIKEWTFAGDVVQAVWALMNQDHVYECVIGSGIGHSIEEWLDACFTQVGRQWRDHVVLKDGFVAEYERLVSDPSLIFSLGWKPQVSFKELAKMMMS